MRAVKIFPLMTVILVLFGLSCATPKYPDGLYAELNTAKGQIVLQLEFEKTPMTVANFVGLAEGKIENAALPLGTPYFDGTIFHRVVPNHVIQAGIPVNGRDLAPGYTFPNEIAPELKHNSDGILGMANSGPHTNGSQFYITLSDRSYLDGNYTVFGHVTAGLDVVHAIVQDDVLESVKIVRVGRKAKNFKPQTQSFVEMVEAAKERVAEEEKALMEKESAIIQDHWPEAITTESGLKYVVTKEGEGQIPTQGNTVKAVYSGRTIFGELPFTSGKDGFPSPIQEATPFDLKLGESRTIPGILEAVLGMRKGEARTLIVHAGLAFRSSGFYAPEIPGQKRFVIPPNTTLVFEIEILDITR